MTHKSFQLYRLKFRNWTWITCINLVFLFRSVPFRSVPCVEYCIRERNVYFFLSWKIFWSGFSPLVKVKEFFSCNCSMNAELRWKKTTLFGPLGFLFSLSSWFLFSDITETFDHTSIRTAFEFEIHPRSNHQTMWAWYISHWD